MFTNGRVAMSDEEVVDVPYEDADVNGLPWWEEVVPDDPLSGGPDPLTDDPLRSAHYAHIDSVLTNYFDEIKVALADRLKSLYEKKNGVAPLSHDQYFGMGLDTSDKMHSVLVKDVKLRTEQIYRRHVHNLMIGQYRRDETIVHMPTRKEYVVSARPNQLELDAKGQFQYGLKDPDTGLVKMVPASIVESIIYIRSIDGVLAQQPMPPRDEVRSSSCCVRDPADRWRTDHGTAPAWTPDPCPPRCRCHRHG